MKIKITERRERKTRQTTWKTLGILLLILTTISTLQIQTLTLTPVDQSQPAETRAPPQTPTPTLEWKYFTAGHISYSSPTVADVDGDGKNETIVGANDYKVHCLNGSGAEKWNYKTMAMIQCNPAVGDLNGDGKLEIVIQSLDGYLY